VKAQLSLMQIVIDLKLLPIISPLLKSEDLTVTGVSPKLSSGLKELCLFALLCFLLSACVDSQPVSKAPLTTPTVYEWIGPGPQPSVKQLMNDKYICARNAEPMHSRRAKSTSEAWQTAVDFCMRSKGWGHKVVN
jgi:hypothetical protein